MNEHDRPQLPDDQEQDPTRQMDDYEMPTRRIEPVEAAGLPDVTQPVTAPSPPISSGESAYTVPPAPPPPVYGGYDDRPRRRRRGKTARERRDSGLYLPWWSLLILLAVVAFFAALLFMGLNLLGGQFTPGGETPVVIVITSTSTPRPTATPFVPSPTPVVTATPTAIIGAVGSPAPDTAAVPPPGVSDDLSIGAVVTVTDVGQAGLNIRQGPGTGFPVLFIAAEGSQFEIIGGPEEGGGFIWWQVRDPQDVTQQAGWAVQDFLVAVQP